MSHASRRLRSPFVRTDPLDILARHGLGQASATYPPYDIVQTGPERLRVVVAVAGFAIGELSVTVSGDQLVIRGRKASNSPPASYLHRGIALRQFQRTFALDAAVTVIGADLNLGLLTVELALPASQGPVRATTVGLSGNTRSQSVQTAAGGRTSGR